jgi:hypothetical protein
LEVALLVERTWLRFFLMLFAVAIMAGCAGPTGRPLTPNDVASYGTARFDAPTGKVFSAVQGALKSEGYQVASADSSKGLIKTNRKLVRAVAVGNDMSAQAIEITRQYLVKVRPAGSATVVVAEPRVFQGDLDLSDGNVWDIEGPMGERKLWSQLFRDIKEGL